MPGTLHRRPRYLRFLMTGALVGLAVNVVVVAVRAGAVERPVLLFFYLGLLLSGLGALLGGLVAVVVEPRRR